MTTTPPGYVCSTEKLEVTQRLAGINLLGVAVGTGLLLLLIPVSGRPGSVGLFLGRFHPVVVHLPIGILAVALGLDIATRLGRCTMEWARWLYVAASWTGFLAVAAGLWLAQAGGYDADTLFWHRLSGIAVAVGAAAVPWLQSVIWSRSVPDALALASTALLGVALVISGHQGGALTHGPNFLAAHAPGFLQGLLGEDDPGQRLMLGAPDTTRIYHAVVAPILKVRCAGCHGTDKKRGGLDLRYFETLMAGGDDGAVVESGRPESSELIARILLPDGHEDQMPPATATPLSPSDAQLLAWWIDQGADTTTTLAQSEMEPQVHSILEAYGLGSIRTGVWALDLPPPDPGAVAALADRGVRVERVAESENLLSVRCPDRASCFGDSAAALHAVGPHIAWLDLARTNVTDADMEFLAQLPHLEKVWLQRTGISRLDALAGSRFLQYLNVTETGVTSDALEHVRHVADVFTWGSPAGNE